jgi:putative tricarboxylic transport membrane protein
MVDAGKMRVLGVSSEKRLITFPDFPTFREQGFDVVLDNSRGFVAPGKISDDAKYSLSGIFEKLSQISPWKEYVAKDGAEVAFLPADEYKKFLADESAKYDKLMRKAGLIK